MTAPTPAALDTLAEAIIRDVAELPNRTSPADWPEAMLITADELRAVLADALAAIQANVEADTKAQVEALTAEREEAKKLMPIPRNAETMLQLAGIMEIRALQAEARALSADTARASAEAALAEAREALRPFADFCEKAERFVEAAAKSGGATTFPTMDFRLADFRRARAAMEKTP